MAITFPNSPSSGDTHTTSNGLQYTYDGEKWTTIGTNSAGTWTRTGTTVSLTTAGDDLNVDSGTLFVDASTNRVGVGTTAGAYKLVVSGGVATTGIVASILNPVSGGNSKIHFSDNATYNWTAGTVGNAFAITPTEASNSAGTPALFINSSGNVGIGDSSPSYKLTLKRTDASGAYFYGAASSDNGARGLQFTSSDNGIYLGAIHTIDATSSGGQIAFATGNTERMRITSAGLVGIATTAPNAELHVGGSEPHIDIGNGNRGKIGFKGHDLFIGASSGSGSIIFKNSIVSTSSPADSGTERMRIDSSGRLLVGTTTAGLSAGDDLTLATTGNTGLTIRSGTTSSGSLYFSDGTAEIDQYKGLIQYTHNGNYMRFLTDNTERLRIDSSGRLLVGTSSARTNYSNSTAYGPLLNLEGTSNSSRVLSFIHNDSSGGPLLVLGSTGGSTAGSNTLVAAQSTLGFLSWQGADGTDLVEAASIKAQVDGTPGANDMPGRLVFATTADGASSSTERMRINSSGRVGIGTTSPPHELSVHNASTTAGTIEANRFSVRDNYGNVSGLGNGFVSPAANTLAFATNSTERLRIASNGDVFFAKTADVFSTPGVRISALGLIEITRNQGGCLNLNRTTDDGGLVGFYQNGVAEGNIDVNGTTVSYNGAHLSRWSQLPGNASRVAIYRGTVLSNIDEMCEWGDEDNEQLNRMKVSDVEGDRNASGVFQSWDDDDDTYTNDFYCAMTGDFVIRIAQGTTVARGDLLMSAGDGTAKPQDDDIVRSKTIAKVTSTTVSTTYSDNSYCVPCVLMAC